MTGSAATALPAASASSPTGIEQFLKHLQFGLDQRDLLHRPLVTGLGPVDQPVEPAIALLGPVDPHMKVVQKYTSTAQSFLVT